jgi:adenine-specific DNA-methyltransferase
MDNQPTKIDLISADICKSKLEALLAIFPGVFTDGVIDVKRLSSEIGIPFVGMDESDETFGLVWAGKRNAINSLQQRSLASLSPILDDSINWDTAQNVFIEGDNLEVLKLLQKSYNDQVKLIYIDPPYNTGSDFVYKDDFSDPIKHYLEVTGQLDDEGNRLRASSDTSGRKSSKWLNMMYPRLLLARNLLKDDGLILIHIDEHEQANLQLLLNEIFGKENSLGVIVWDKRNPKGDSGAISSQHEYLLAYARNFDKFIECQGFEVAKPSAQLMLDKASKLFSQIGKNSIPEVIQEVITKYGVKIENQNEISRVRTLDDIRVEYREWLGKQPFSGGELAYNQINDEGDVYRLVSMAWPNKKTPSADYLIPLIHPITGLPCSMPERGWRNPSDTMKKLLEKGEIAFGKDEKTQPQRIYKLKNYMSAALSSILPYGGSDDALLAAMGVPFDTPKPTDLVRQLVASCTSASDIVLDFFAGSGTTGHAVMLQNLKDGANRRFILVNIPEETNEKSEARKSGILNVSEITKMRLRKVYEEIPAAKSTGLRCLRLSPSNFKNNQINKLNQELDLQPFTLLDAANPNAIASEVFIKFGVKLDSPWERHLLETNEVIISESVALVVGLQLNESIIAEILRFQNIETLVFLEDAFAGKDAMKANTFFACKKANLNMKTV